MNFQFYLEKLFASFKFQDFIKENPSAYLCSGFFTIDRQRENSLTTSSESDLKSSLVRQDGERKRGQSKEGKGNKVHIDYFIPETKKVFSFQLENQIDVIPVDQIGDLVLEKIPDNIDFDFEEVEKMIVDRMEQEGIKNKLQKILLSLQNVDKKDILVGTVFISGLGMIKVRIDLENMNMSDFEKKSFFDMVNVMRKK